MFLEHLRLTNVRCFKDVEIDFKSPTSSNSKRNNRKWTVLLGENGTGKSIVLKGIALVMAGSDALSELIGDPDSWIRAKARSAKIVARARTAQGEEREFSLEIRRGDGISKLIKRSTKTLKPLEAALKHSKRNYLTFAFGSSRQLGDGGLLGTRGSRGFSHPRARSMASLFDREAELNPLDSWAMRLDYSTDGAGVETVRQVLTDFLPDLSFSHIDKRNEALVFDTPDGKVPLRHLSDGYQNVAAWVGDLLFQITAIFDDYDDPLSAHGLLLIDEVDLHLHPKWQRSLLKFLDSRLKNMQLVVTTHSVVTAQQSPPGALHYCIRRDGRPTVEAFDGDPGMMLLNQLISTEAFGNSSDESLAVEEDKAQYRDLHHKSEKTPEDRAEMNKIADRLGKRPEDETENIVLSRRQRELMRKLLDSHESEAT